MTYFKRRLFPVSLLFYLLILLVPAAGTVSAGTLPFDSALLTKEAEERKDFFEQADSIIKDNGFTAVRYNKRQWLGIEGSLLIVFTENLQDFYTIFIPDKKNGLGKLQNRLAGNNSYIKINARILAGDAEALSHHEKEKIRNIDDRNALTKSTLKVIEALYNNEKPLSQRLYKYADYYIINKSGFIIDNKEFAGVAVIPQASLLKYLRETFGG
jgi:hypothetical protein